MNQPADASAQPHVGRRRRKKIRDAGLDINAIDVNSLQFDRQGNVVLDGSDPTVAVSDWAMDVEFHEQLNTGRGRSRSRGRGRGRGRGGGRGNSQSAVRPGGQQFSGAGGQQFGGGAQQRSHSAAPAGNNAYNQNNVVRRYDRDLTKDFEEWRHLQVQLNLVNTCFGCLQPGHGFRRDFADCTTGRCPLCSTKFTDRNGHAAMDCPSLPSRGEDILPTMRGENQNQDIRQLQIQQ